MSSLKKLTLTLTLMIVICSIDRCYAGKLILYLNEVSFDVSGI